jgi:hypothetical protein
MLDFSGGAGRSDVLVACCCIEEHGFGGFYEDEI